jgi:hypothetical protein
MTVFFILLCIAGWFILGLVLLNLRYGLIKKIFKSTSAVPWASTRAFKTLGMDHGHTTLMFVSRHDIAECGLTCPRCRTVVAERGDFSGVRRALVNGIENEVLKCPGRVVVDDMDQPCPEWLAASPDTEHGDHLGPDGNVSVDPIHDQPEFYRFKRISPEQALREKYGVDIVPTEDQIGVQIADDTVVPAEPVKTNRHDVLAGEELQKAIQAELAKQDHEKVLAAEPPAPIDPDATPITGLPTNKDSHV